jgi:glycosyltransferase involved in cell wall biosynthesis
MVCPHELVTGGSQLIAIAFAERLRERGHEVEVYAPPGPLRGVVEGSGLKYRAAPEGGKAGPRAVLSMARAVGRFAPDIVHAFESGPAVSSAGASLFRPHKSVVTMLSMDVPDFLPRNMPLLVGTAALAEQARGSRGDVHLMEPPIDLERDEPADAGPARDALGVPLDAFVISVVGRLSAEHQKARGVAAAIDEMAADPDLPRTVLLVAGDGDERDVVREAADRAGEASERLDIRLLGNVVDPRPVYDAADVVFGMGSSALRGMAHRKPVIVQGGDGFWKLVSPHNAPAFLADGFFGRGATGESFVRILAGLREERRRAQLGAFGQALVHERYALSAAVDRLERIYMSEMDRPRPRASSMWATWSSMLRYLRYRVALAAPTLRRVYRRMTGRTS